jgi:hypothetical protein
MRVRQNAKAELSAAHPAGGAPLLATARVTESAPALPSGAAGSPRNTDFTDLINVILYDNFNGSGAR